jgi:hypothetical protein
MILKTHKFTKLCTKNIQKLWDNLECSCFCGSLQILPFSVLHEEIYVHCSCRGKLRKGPRQLRTFWTCPPCLGESIFCWSQESAVKGLQAIHLVKIPLVGSKMIMNIYEPYMKWDSHPSNGFSVFPLIFFHKMLSSYPTSAKKVRYSWWILTSVG